MRVGEIRQFCKLPEDGQSLMRAAMNQLNLSARASAQPHGTLTDASGIFVALFMIPVAVALDKTIRRQSPTFSLISLIVGMTEMLAMVIIQALYVPRLIQIAQQGVLSRIALFFIGLWMILVNALGRAANPALFFWSSSSSKIFDFIITFKPIQQVCLIPINFLYVVK
jgi:hypothetical protein